jgi:hypothetical protein
MHQPLYACGNGYVFFFKIHVMMSHDLPCVRHNWWIWCMWLCEYPLNVLHKKYEQGWMKGYVHNMIKSPKIRNVWSWTIELFSMWQVNVGFSYHKFIKLRCKRGPYVGKYIGWSHKNNWTRPIIWNLLHHYVLIKTCFAKL